MAATTFSGPIRSENNVQLVSKNTTTGVVSDRTQDFGLHDARRYYLCEPFYQRPAINADIDQAYTVEVAPHLDTNQSAWTGVKWGTENSVEWEASVMLPAIDNQKTWAGLKLTNDQLIATDADQVYFKFQTDATNSESFDDFTKWHFIHSIDGTDFISQIPVTVAANTPYHLKIKIDADRKATIFVNGIQYNVTTTSGSTGGTAVTAVQPGKQVVKTGALTNDVDFIPYAGIEAGAAAAEALNVHYIACSRNVFE
jgi:hypothetical protein